MDGGSIPQSAKNKIYDAFAAILGKSKKKFKDAIEVSKGDDDFSNKI